jgi:DNA replication licensing factor MCM7
MLDKPDIFVDELLARHVANVHKLGDVPAELDFEPMDAELIRSYIASARTFEPIIPK